MRIKTPNRNEATIADLKHKILDSDNRLPRYFAIQEIARKPDEDITERELELMFHYVYDKNKNTIYFDNQIFESTRPKQIPFEYHVKQLKYKNRINKKHTQTLASNK